ncbi:MAG: CAP domain-containing protein [Bacteroidia bacterium]
MMKSIISLAFLFLTFSGFVMMPEHGKKYMIPGDFCLSAEELKLYQLINDYRVSLGLSKIPLSKSLSYTAYRHTHDLAENLGALTHSWSDCDYDKDGRCMWDQPLRYTDYKGQAYECAHYRNTGSNAQAAFNGWKNSPSHNELLANLNGWETSKWRAIGVSIHQQYACIWVGEEDDSTEDIPEICPQEEKLASTANSNAGVAGPKAKTMN